MGLSQMLKACRLNGHPLMVFFGTLGSHRWASRYFGILHALGRHPAVMLKTVDPLELDQGIANTGLVHDCGRHLEQSLGCQAVPPGSPGECEISSSVLFLVPR